MVVRRFEQLDSSAGMEQSKELPEGEIVALAGYTMP